MCTSVIIGVTAVTLLVIAFVVFAQAVGSLGILIALTGLLYRYAEERYPEAVGITGGATGIIEPGRATSEQPLGDIDNDPDEDLEAETGIQEDYDWLYGNR